MSEKRTFMWAVEQMKLGKKVRRKDWEETYYIHILNDVIQKSKYIYGDNYVADRFGLIDFEATDWEVVDEDKDWNLVNQSSIYEGEGEGRTYLHQDIKKCRDLIIKEIKGNNYDHQLNNLHIKYSKIIDIINKRFGDLK